MSATAEDVSRFLHSNRGAARFRVPATALQFDALLRKGLALSVADAAASHLGVPRERLARLLRVSPSTLERRFKDKADLTGAEADALYRVIGVLGVAQRVLVSEENVRSWMSRPQPGLDGRTPLDLLDNAAGTEAVILLLEQIYHGITP
jgi:putative toxin-antitoxin system antitoxin component (TIGR02293 family)